MVDVDALNSIKFDYSILEDLKRLGENMTANDIREQRISFILGSLSGNSRITRRMVEDELDRIYGK